MLRHLNISTECVNSQKKKKSFTETDSRRDRKPEQSYIIEDIQLVAKHFPTKKTAQSLVGEKFFQMFQEHL